MGTERFDDPTILAPLADLMEAGGATPTRKSSGAALNVLAEDVRLLDVPVAISEGETP